VAAFSSATRVAASAQLGGCSPAAEPGFSPCEVERYLITVRARRIHAFGRKLAWCSGAVVSNNSNGGFEEGEPVTICLQVAETQGMGEDARAFERELAQKSGGADRNVLHVELLCERREAGPTNLGAAKVLHAVGYKGALAVEVVDSDDEPDDPEEHQADKEQRHLAFAKWLLEVFGAQLLCAGRGIIDVAAGKGHLTEALRSQCTQPLPCTLVEPVLRGGKDDYASMGQDSVWLAEEFDAERFPQDHAKLLAGCSTLVGLHPDQATEAIVDVALRFRKPFAVVPCCVYPRLFPGRRLGTGQGVTTYRGFQRYLRAKDSRIRIARLPFAGRNKVLYVADYSNPPFCQAPWREMRCEPCRTEQ